jgi:hypothetical protein
MAILGRDAILSSKDLKQEVVKVPEWGGEVIVRTLSAFERVRWEESLTENDKTHPYSGLIKMLSMCLVDEQGNQLFTDSDVEELGKKSIAPLLRIQSVALRLNKVDVKSLEELSKN